MEKKFEEGKENRFKGIIAMMFTILSIFLVLTVKSFILSKIYIHQLIEMGKGTGEVSVLGILGLSSIVLHTFLLIISAVMLTQFIKSYFLIVDRRFAVKISRYVVGIIFVLIVLTSVSEFSDMLGLKGTDIKLEITQKLIFYFLVRIPAGVINTSTYIILALTVMYGIKIYEKFSSERRKEGIIYSVIITLKGFLIMIFVISILKIQEYFIIEGKTADFFKSVRLFFFYLRKLPDFRKEIINHHNFLGIFIIFITGIFLYLLFCRKKNNENSLEED
ncbi:MAG: hypothetical protein Q4D53_07500 [Leptotrichiaceae bacterium]|nr:hypothetical protein [Leptotrichiaceae bacterium]